MRPTTPLRVAGLGERPLPAMLEDTAEKLVDRALEQRPDLLPWVAVVRAREADIRKAQSESHPKIVVTGNVLQNIGRVRTSDVPGWADGQPHGLRRRDSNRNTALRRRFAQQPARGGQVQADASPRRSRYPPGTARLGMS